MNKSVAVKQSFMVALCMMGFGSMAACNRSPDTQAKSIESARMEVDSADTKFFTKAAQSGMLEVKLAQLASTQADSSQVKQFAELMLADHQANNKLLMTLATQKAISLPPAFDDKGQGIIDELKTKSGHEFDKAYRADMIDAHKDMLALLENTVKSSKDIDIRNFAQQSLPTIQHHLSMAQALEQRE